MHIYVLQSTLIRHVETLLLNVRCFLRAKAKKAMSNKECVQNAGRAIKILDKWILLAQGYATTTAATLAFQHAVGHLEVHLVACVLDRKSRSFSKVEDAALSVLEDFGKQIGSPVTPAPEWLGNIAQNSATGSSQSQVAVFRKYNDQGNLTNQSSVMMSMCFKVGSKVHRGTSTAVIASIKGDDVALTLEDQTQAFVASSSFVSGEWRLVPETKEQQEISWLADEPRQSTEFSNAMLRALVLTQMWQQLEKLDGWDSLKMYTSPKAIKTTKAWPRGKLHLPCATTRVMLVEAAKTSADQLVIGNYGSSAVILCGMNKASKGGGGFVNPFWAIPRASEEASANMEAGAHGFNFPYFGWSGCFMIVRLGLVAAFVCFD